MKGYEYSDLEEVIQFIDSWLERVADGSCSPSQFIDVMADVVSSNARQW